MNTEQRIKLIRLIEKIDKNPEFSHKLGVRNASDFTSKQDTETEIFSHSQEMAEGDKYVINFICILHDLVYLQAICILGQSILGDIENTLYSGILPGDLDWNGSRRIALYCISDIDCRWNYCTCNI